MNKQSQQSKSIDAAKVNAEYQKAVAQNQQAAPNEVSPTFTAPVSVAGITQKQAVPPLQAAKGNDEVMSQPQSDSTPAINAAATVKPVPQETAQEAVHQVMPKAEARKLTAEVTPKSPLEKATS